MLKKTVSFALATSLTLAACAHQPKTFSRIPASAPSQAVSNDELSEDEKTFLEEVKKLLPKSSKKNDLTGGFAVGDLVARWDDPTKIGMITRLLREVVELQWISKLSDAKRSIEVCLKADQYMADLFVKHGVSAFQQISAKEFIGQLSKDEHRSLFELVDSSDLELKRNVVSLEKLVARFPKKLLEENETAQAYAKLRPAAQGTNIFGQCQYVYASLANPALFRAQREVVVAAKRAVEAAEKARQSAEQLGAIQKAESEAKEDRPGLIRRSFREIRWMLDIYVPFFSSSDGL